MIFRHLLNMRSHPTWVRGLKLYLSLTRQKISVAPYVGAWIETRRGHTWRWQHAQLCCRSYGYPLREQTRCRP